MKKVYFGLVCLLIFVSSCTVNPSNLNSSGYEKQPTNIPLESNFGGIKGQISNVDNWLDEAVAIFAFAAPYVGDPEDEGIFIYGGDFNKFGEINSDGYFQIANLEPGIYILLIGPDINNVTVYQNSNRAVKILVEADQYADVGSISLSN